MIFLILIFLDKIRASFSWTRQVSVKAVLRLVGSRMTGAGHKMPDHPLEYRESITWIPAWSTQGEGCFCVC